MPELPEVETIVRACRAGVVGRRIRDFRTLWAPNASPSGPEVRRSLLDRTVTRLTRRGKFIVFHLDDGAALLVHLRMSGRLEWDGNGYAESLRTRPTHVRAWWRFDDGARLLFRDARKFGRILFTRNLAATMAGVGLEPLGREFTASWLQRELAGRNRRLKPLLLDQSFIAGLGNIYTDESLFEAGLHPLLPASRLRPAQVAALHGAIRQVLRKAIRHHGTSIDWIYPGGWMQRHLKVYGRTGEPCRRCATPIEALRVGQRGTHICPRCQKLRLQPLRSLCAASPAS